jgi:acyl carrier protein
MTYETPAMRAIRDYILDEFLPGEDPSQLTPDTQLLSTGVLDSLATLKLVSFLEHEFKIQVKPHEADEAHLNTLRSICDLVETKRLSISDPIRGRL